jgi:type VI secretion system protein
VAFLDKFCATRRAGASRDELVERVIENLHHVLGTRRGYGWFRQDFGMSDPDARASRARIAEAVMRDVRENIERHEPRVRIRDIATAPADNPLRLAFTVHCTVLDDARTLRLEFDAVLNRFSLGSR